MFILGFSQILNLPCLLLLLAGVLMGILFGASPGLTTSMGLALMLPLTYSMPMIWAIALLIGMYIGGVSGGLITAILLNIPGTPASMPTTFDGSPMAQNGQPSKALSWGMISSFIGGTISFILLFFIAPTLSKLAIKLSNVDYFSITLFALVLVAGLAGKSLPKGILSALFGMMFATVGMATVDGSKRYTFRSDELLGGFVLISVLIGLYAIIELLKLAEEKSIIHIKVPKFKMSGFDIQAKEFKGQIKNLTLSSAIGSGIGFLPGIGAGVASIMSYTIIKNRSKTPEKFGTGIVDGIVASEAANNAVIGGALIPLLTMGIPGDASTSILLAGFLMHGITPGPLMFTNNTSLVYGLFACLIVANLFMIICEYFALSGFLQVLRVKKHFLIPIIMTFCVLGAFASNNRLFDIWAAIIFGVIAYLFKLFKIPLPPFMMGFILGPLVEKNLLRGLQLSYGSFIPFLIRPVSLIFLVLTIAYIVFTIKKQKINKKKIK